MFENDRHENIQEVGANCQICGREYSEKELNIIASPLKLSGDYTMSVCIECMKNTAEESFKDAASILEEVVLIARATASNPERRLQAIINLIEK